MNVSYPLETAKILMMFIGEKILKLSMEKEAKIDSTPLEASRHDKHADYNPHYECKMDKAHITMVGTYPVFMTYTKGLAGDSSELINHIEALKKMNANLKFYSADGGYDSFFNHSDIWYYLNAKPIIPTLQIPQSIKKVKMKESITGEIKSGKSVEIFMHQWKKTQISI